MLSWQFSTTKYQVRYFHSAVDLVTVVHGGDDLGKRSLYGNIIKLMTYKPARARTGWSSSRVDPVASHSTAAAAVLLLCVCQYCTTSGDKVTESTNLLNTLLASCHHRVLSTRNMHLMQHARGDEHQKNNEDVVRSLVACVCASVGYY